MPMHSRGKRKAKREAKREAKRKAKRNAKREARRKANRKVTQMFFMWFKKMQLCATSDHFWAWAGVGLPGVVFEKVRKGALLYYIVHSK